ncbi:hypothetical protein LAZ67_16002493 [Cordylochernes scorpioides]|uniref:Transposase n=1 Tax=Cordylochernes scorpioides TaxID=51811 RepID=A0ABY6LBZ6_9ARAC|nr:hypothetical protein LAZ67_16002493 [Cordylochernes scorpioides]
MGDAIAPLDSHISEFPVHGYRSGSGLTTPFLNSDKTINSEVHCQDLQAIHLKLPEKMPSLVYRKGVILLHDNARPHSAFTTQQNITLLIHLICPLPISIFFEDLDHFLHGKRLINWRNMKNAFLDSLASKQPDFY